MKAIQIGEGPDFPLDWRDVETPQPAPGEVRIRIHATTVNRADLLQRKGLYPPPSGASPILGLECSGFIDAIGSGVSKARLGQRVCALLAGGGYAQYAVCPHEHAIPISENTTFEQAACVPEVWATAWLKLVMEGALVRGERVLVHAGASGVGCAAIQLCKLVGAECFVTVGTTEKLNYCLNLGATGGAIRHDGPWLEALKNWHSDGVNLVLDPVGGPYLDANLRALQTDGRLVVMGLLGGREAEIDLGRLLVKRLQIRGSTLRSRSDQVKSVIMRCIGERILPELEFGRLEDTIHTILPIDAASDAHRILATNTSIGKVVLLVP